MPRIGKHPLKTKSFVPEVTYKDITVSTIVYIPSLEGYWREALEILKLFFNSLYQNTTLPFDLMVFDNGSCSEVRNYLTELHNRGKIQYMVFSEQNLRKLGALDFLLSAAPGEYIAYADSDVYFLPGWLEESIKVLKTFPEAAKVTALPMVGGDSTRFPEFQEIKKTNIVTRTGKLIPDKYITAHQSSLGETDEAYANRTKDRNDVILTRKGIEVLLSGADFQFTIRKKAVFDVIPLKIQEPSEYYDPIYSPVLEKRLADLGYWRLCTSGYFVHHMGNHIPNFKEELPWIDHSSFEKQYQKKPDENAHSVNKNKFVSRITHTRILRKLLQKLHTISYRLLYD